MRIFIPKTNIGSSSSRKLRRALNSIRKQKAHRDYVERMGTSNKKTIAAVRMRNKPTHLESILKTSLSLAVGHRYAVYTQWVERGYILDFYIRELKLCFEADGPLHDLAYDRRRDRHLERSGILTIRFNHKELHHDLETVDRTIHREIHRREQQVKGGFPINSSNTQPVKPPSRRN